MRPRFDPGAMKMPWRKKWQPTPVLLPGDSHGQRSLAGYSPWGRRVRHDGVTQHKPTSGDGGGQGSLACSLWDRSQTGLSKRTTPFSVVGSHSGDPGHSGTIRPVAPG